MDGEISAASEKGVGTTFTVSLPLAAETEEDAGQDGARTAEAEV